MSIKRLSPPKDTKANVEKQSTTGTAPTSSGQTIEFRTSFPQYEIDVRVDERVTRRFITTCPLSISGADGILGRGTRVWAARELLQGGEQSEDVVAIKDYWIDADREREGDIVKSIMDAAPDEAGRAILKDHIVDVLCHGDVYRKQIRIIRRDGQHLEATYVMARDETRNPKQAIARKDSAIAPHRVRCRNRLVMRQVGKPLHSEQSLRAAFSALHDACTGEHAVTTLPIHRLTLTKPDDRPRTDTSLRLDAL